MVLGPKNRKKNFFVSKWSKIIKNNINNFFKCIFVFFEVLGNSVIWFIMMNNIQIDEQGSLWASFVRTNPVQFPKSPFLSTDSINTLISALFFFCKLDVFIWTSGFWTRTSDPTKSQPFRFSRLVKGSNGYLQKTFVDYLFSVKIIRKRSCVIYTEYDQQNICFGWTWVWPKQASSNKNKIEKNVQ